MININDLGWVFIYVCIFGISEFIVTKYIKTDTINILYYVMLGLLGVSLLFLKSSNFNSKKD